MLNDLASFIFESTEKQEAFKNEFNLSGKEPITLIKLFMKYLKF